MNARLETNQIAFIFDDLTEFFVSRDLIDALKQEGFLVDIIIPSDSGYGDLPKHTFNTIKKLGYSPLENPPKEKTYKILLSPYPTITAIKRTNFIYHIRMPYSTISAKPNPTYTTISKLDYDAIICLNKYEPLFLNCYGADCFAVPYWKYYNFKKDVNKSKKPRLLILPTFGQDTSCIDYLDNDTLENIKKHFKVTIKAHHATHFGQDGENTLKKLKSLADEFYDSGTPITELLQKTDYVLSDNSGAIFEAIYSDTLVATFSKDLNARHIGKIDTLQYRLAKDGIIPHTDDPKEILPMLLKLPSYAERQHKIYQELFIKPPKDPLRPTIDIIKKYISKNSSDDRKKILHDLMLKEWQEYKIMTERCQYMSSEVIRLKNLNAEKDSALSSRSYKIYKQIISPLEKIRRIKNGQ